MVELYYNSNQFTHVLPILIQEFDSPFQMYEALAEYYDANGLFTNMPSRSYRYQVLLDFACSAAPHKRELFTQLLTFDMYLRENLKSRPCFSPENSIDKKLTRRFFEQEAETHQYLNADIYYGCTSVQLLKMTHMEKFTFPVWEENLLMCADKMDTPEYILFDYEKRSALTHDAAFYKINL